MDGLLTSRSGWDGPMRDLSIGLISFCEDTRRSRRLRPFPLRGPKRTGPARRHAAWVNEAWGCSKPGGCSATVLAKTASATELDGRFRCYRHAMERRHAARIRPMLDGWRVPSLLIPARGPSHNLQPYTILVAGECLLRSTISLLRAPSC